MTKFSKLLFLTLSLVVSIATVQAQSKFGNEWINPTKTYYKFKVAQDGMYRVTYEELVQAGLPAESIKGIDLKLFNYGTEQAIYVSDANEFNEGDYLEFYGERNTIGLDSLLYNDWKEDLFNPDYSIVTDTNAYFLTVSPETNNLRYTLVNPDYNNNNLTPFPYYLHEEKVVYSNQFLKNDVGKWQFSSFDASEGFGDIYRQNSNTILKSDKIFLNGPNAKLSFRYTHNGVFNNVIFDFNNNVLGNVSSQPPKTIQQDFDININDLKENNTLKLTNNQSIYDQHRLAFALLQYPRLFDFSNRSSYFFKMSPTTTKSFIEISNFKHNNNSSFVYDIINKIRYNTNINGNNDVQCILNPQNKTSKYLMIDANDGVLKPNKITKLNFKTFANNGQDYIIITNKNLHNEGVDYIKEYADYRQSSEGGNYKPEIVHIDDIYEHFGYGIERHFYGIKNFASFMKSRWENVKFVLIIGKAVEYQDLRTKDDILNAENKVFFVPTFGVPGSDNLLFSDKFYPDPYFAIGRIAATTPTDIKNYLEKVKQYEQAPFGPQTEKDKFWMKRILHLGGGSTVGEQSSIRSGLESMQLVIENSMKGADVNTYYKTNTEILASAASDQIKNIINTGVNVITFFGHSAVGTFDFSLENPKDYNNFGKYPIINSLGCYSGNIHTPGTGGISEKFVFEKQKGSIGFLASSGTGFIGSLTLFGRELYDKIGNTHYGSPMGDIVKAINQNHRTENFSNLAFYQQLTYHGDPAIKLYHSDGADIIFDYESVRTNPELITSSTKEIELTFDIVNLGKNISDSIDIVFYHLLQNGEYFDTISTRVPIPISRQSFSVKLKSAGVAGIGKNTILGQINPTEKYNEKPTPEAFNNNNLESGTQNGFAFYILDNSAIPVYPDNYAIVNSADIILKASTSNAFLAKNKYRLELDTTKLFNSPSLVMEYIESNGGIISWKPNVNMVPDMVYYWRISPDSINPEIGYLWQNSSFIYLPNSSEGWNHSHYFQLADNNGSKLINIEENRKYKFPPAEIFVQMKNGIYVPDIIGYRTNFSAVRAGIRPWIFTSSALCFVITDPITGDLVNNIGGGAYGSIATTTSRSNQSFSFKTETPEQRKTIMDFVENVIQDGYYVTVFSALNSVSDNLNTQSWKDDELIYGKSLFSVFEDQGAKDIRKLDTIGTVPFIFMFTKNGLPISEVIGTSINDEIDATMIVPYQSNQGLIKTLPIGPATKWNKIEYKFDNVTSTDTLYLNVFAINDNGEEKEVISKTTMQTIDLENLNIDSFPYLRLEYFIKDQINRSVPDVDFFRVYYQGYPDVAIDPTSFYTFYNDTIVQGDKYKLAVAIGNLSDIKTDSLDVKYSFINLSNNLQIIDNKTYRHLNIKDTIHIEIEKTKLFETGEFLVVIEANPDKRFLEKHYFNNIGKKNLFIKKDIDNPLMDVYFDGIKIMDGDIVSPTPEIKITLQDDNSFLPITDPNLFEIKLDTGRNQIVNIPMDSPNIKFIPADSNNKFATLQYYPTLKSGEYKLYVQASDASGNKSGVNPRSVNFNVIEEESISNVLNYPNPFSTSTQFVFTLTGSNVPEVMSISIMTLSGKVVREITKEELGPLHIGINRTAFKWDGTDEYGSKLANGVYLYKVNVRNAEGEKYDAFKTAKTDSFFTKGFGKMVILR